MTIRQRLALLLHRRKMYRAVFLDASGNPTEAGRLVLADLARFTRLYQSTTQFSPVTRMIDTHATLRNEGRREVFNLITQNLNLSEAQIYALLEREYGRSES